MAQRWESSPLTNVARVQIPSSKPYVWVAFVVGSLLCSERFFSGYSSFPLSSKTNISKFQFDQESGRRRTTLWMCYLQIIIYYLFIYLNEKILLHIITYPLAICVRDGRKKTVETWLSIRERKAEGGSSKDGSRKGTKWRTPVNNNNNNNSLFI